MPRPSCPDPATKLRTVADVRGAMLRKLADSALTVADAKLLAYAPHTAQSAAKQFPELPHHRAGFAIPYHNTEGRPT